MNRSKSLYKDIVRRTQNSELQWRQAEKSAYRFIIRNIEQASQVFEATWKKNNCVQTLVLVDKAFLAREHLLFPAQEIHTAKLFIFEGEKLVELLSDVDLNPIEMSWLSKNIVCSMRQSRGTMLPLE
ncbi:hypothetical protein LJR289_002953 [Pseudoduganella sp. LjRoot289]|uniref:hypothetical protein n=1 Tax=Pseudoduganella sp. LjRoot289 TaxID=3342314 RepID=UPI003ECFCAB0